MRTRIEITDEMVDRYLVSMNTAEWTTRKGVRKSLEAALGDLLERRTSERRKRDIGIPTSEVFQGIRQGLQGAPCGANKEPPAADHSADEWAYALRSKGEDGAAPAKPAAVEAIDYAHRRDGDTWGGRGHRRGAGGLRIPLPNGHSGHFRVGEACVHTHRRASDRNASGGTDPSSLPSHQDATRDNARPTDTQSPPKVSRAMTDAGCSAYWQETLKGNREYERYAAAYLAMETQRLKEQNWDGLGPGGA